MISAQGLGKSQTVQLTHKSMFSVKSDANRLKRRCCYRFQNVCGYIIALTSDSGSQPSQQKSSTDPKRGLHGRTTTHQRRRQSSGQYHKSKGHYKQYLFAHDLTLLLSYGQIDLGKIVKSIFSV